MKLLILALTLLFNPIETLDCTVDHYEDNNLTVAACTTDELVVFEGQQFKIGDEVKAYIVADEVLLVTAR